MLTPVETPVGHLHQSSLQVKSTQLNSSRHLRGSSVRLSSTCCRLSAAGRVASTSSTRGFISLLFCALMVKQPFCLRLQRTQATVRSAPFELLLVYFNFILVNCIRLFSIAG